MTDPLPLSPRMSYGQMRMANIVVDKHVRLLVSKRFSGYKAEAFSV